MRLDSDDPFAVRAARRSTKSAGAAANDSSAGAAAHESSDDDPVELGAFLAGSAARAATLRSDELRRRRGREPTERCTAAEPPRVESACKVARTRAPVTPERTPAAFPSSASSVGGGAGAGSDNLYNPWVHDGRYTGAEMPADSRGAINVERVARSERKRTLDAQHDAPHDAPPPAASSADVFPLTQALVDDGHSYTNHDYAVQYALIDEDPFLCCKYFFPNMGWRAAFADAHATVRSLVPPGYAYKFGIATCPSVRFHRRDYGYSRLGYDGGVVLFVGSPNACAELETSLIKEWRSKLGCQNVARGGEGKMRPGICSCTYMVYADLSTGLSLEQNAARQNPARRKQSLEQLEAAWRAHGLEGELP